MASTIKPKLRTANGTAPTTSDLADGELAVNSVTKTIYLRVGSSIVALSNGFDGVFSSLTGIPTTLSGFGITDAVDLASTQTITGAKTFTNSGTTVGDGSGNARLNMDSGAGVEAGFRFYSGGSIRWLMRKNTAAETGSNAGSNFEMYRYDDTGTFLALAFAINRATGAVNTGGGDLAAGAITSGGNAVWHAGNLTPSNYMPTSWTLTAGNGLTGGGNGTANRTITMGTPGTITGSSTNAVTSTSHTHALTLAAADVNGALGYTAGYINVPLTTQNANYTFVASDVGKGRVHTDATARTYTIPPNVFDVGDVLTVVNFDTANVTIARGSGVTLQIAGTSGGSSANRTVGPRGVATIFCVYSNSFFISGPGVS